MIPSTETLIACQACEIVGNVARRHDVNSNQLFTWGGSCCRRGWSQTGTMVPVEIVPESDRPRRPDHGCAIEIVFGDLVSAVYIAYNGWLGDVNFTLPWPGSGNSWHRMTNACNWADGSGTVAIPSTETLIACQACEIVGNDILGVNVTAWSDPPRQPHRIIAAPCAYVGHNKAGVHAEQVHEVLSFASPVARFLIPPDVGNDARDRAARGRKRTRRRTGRC